MIDRPFYRDARAGTRAGWIEPKADGRWGVLLADGSVRSRSGAVLRRLDVGDAAGFVLLGEWVAGTPWSVRSGHHETLLVFDCLEERGESIAHLPLRERRAAAERVVAEIANPDIAPIPVLTENEAGAWRHWVERRGWEGLVFKDPEAPFGAHWERRKRQVEVDYVCMGVEPRPADPTKARCLLGGLMIDGELRQVIRVGNLPARVRRDAAADPDAFVGRVFKTAGKEAFASGAVRHGVFLGWHPGKAAHECT